MQDTGFVQVPVDRFLALVEAEKSINQLKDEVKQDKNSRKGLYNIKGYDTKDRGLVVAVDFDGTQLLKYLGVIDELKQEVNDAKYRRFEHISIERIEPIIHLNYDENFKLIMEVNK